VENHLTSVSCTHLREVQKNLFGAGKEDEGPSLKEKINQTKNELDLAQ
jgi:hypothetical protein